MTPLTNSDLFPKGTHFPIPIGTVVETNFRALNVIPAKPEGPTGELLNQRCYQCPQDMYLKLLRTAQTLAVEFAGWLNDLGFLNPVRNYLPSTTNLRNSVTWRNSGHEILNLLYRLLSFLARQHV
jgi:hypothetical protein